MVLDSLIKSSLVSRYAFCEESGFNYFAYSLLDEKNRFVLSYCNNSDWLTIFQDDFFPTSPVKDVVLSSRQTMEIWNSEYYDKETASYIERRNKVCQTHFMVTFLLRSERSLTTITLGSPYDLNHFQRFYGHQRQALEQFFRKSLQFSASIPADFVSANDG